MQNITADDKSKQISAVSEDLLIGESRLTCLFVLIDSLRPINTLSVKQGLVFLG